MDETASSVKQPRHMKSENVRMRNKLLPFQQKKDTNLSGQDYTLGPPVPKKYFVWTV